MDLLIVYVCLYKASMTYFTFTISFQDHKIIFIYFLKTYCFQYSDRKKCSDSVIISSVYNNNNNSIVTVDRLSVSET